MPPVHENSTLQTISLLGEFHQIEAIASVCSEVKSQPDELALPFDLSLHTLKCLVHLVEHLLRRDSKLAELSL